MSNNRRKASKKFSGMQVNQKYWKIVPFDPEKNVNLDLEFCKKFICSAGIIAYYCKNKDQPKKICVGTYKDKKKNIVTNERTGFMGGIKRDETIPQGVLREVFEETCGTITIDGCVMKYPGIMAYNEYKGHAMIVFFARVTEETSNDFFQEKVKKCRNPEIAELEWITVEEFKNLVYSDIPDKKGFILYKSLREIIKQSTIKIDDYLR